MHIPDSFLDAKTAATSAVLAGGGLTVALRQVHRHLPRRQVPVLGLAAAFIFVGQMLNFPVAGGTSGHLLGGVLAAVLLGPSAAVIALTSVLIVQCLLFADGGITTLGANIWNLAIINPLVGYAVYRLVRAMWPGPRGMVIAVAFAGWCATVASAVSCAGQLAWSGNFTWSRVLPAMVNIHMVIGIGEGLITTLILTAIVRTRPELVTATTDWSENVRLGLLTALGLAVFVVPFACTWPDGLEQVAATLGHNGEPAAIVPTFRSAALAGAIGTGVAFGLSLLLAYCLVPRSPDEAQLPGSP